MKAERKDVSPFALILIFFILNFMVKQKCFIQPDGISIILKVKAACDMEENYYYSSLLCYKSSYHKSTKRCLCLLLLLVCGDIESQPGPDRNIPELRNLYSRRGLKICLQNIRGLQGKFDEISDILKQHNIDILTLNELFLNNLKAKFVIPGFKFIRKDRKTGTGGGVGIFIRKELNYKRRKESEKDEIKSIFIEIQQKFPNRLLLALSIAPRILQNTLRKILIQFYQIC